MESLKLTTLAMLIPFGLLLPETAAAYPEPLNPLDGLETTCVLRKINSPELKEQNDKSHALPELVESLIAPLNTALLHQDQDTQIRICRLDIELIEAD